ncbi:uroporphyrinogen decarboxylase [Wolbachia pipientis]|uniref:uroporphyrinogen decarboxylase n=1 Tax=Wolbachia pipientis TaxID=955 RepID=UPI0009BF5B15|nr:uroporphyrinogen decarboxylase [Wolbachia pipientis]
MVKDKPLIAKIITSNEPSEKVPIWLMRQAGRSLPEYHKAIRSTINFMDRCYNSDLVTELTLQPVRRFDMDAAIIFSDILVIAHILGCDVSFEKGIGAKITPIETSKSLKDIEEVKSKVLPILNAVSMIRSKLSEDKSLIGFAGGPWTVTSYIVEGGSHKRLSRIKNFSTLDLEKIIEKITKATIVYLIKQIESGVDIVQLFDSNAGMLPKELFKKYIIEPTKKIVSAIRGNFGNFPIIGFPRCAGNLYKDYCEQTGISAVSIDYNVPIEWAKANLNIPIQGNLHPNLLAYNIEEAIKEAKRIMDFFKDLPFIFNLGHGVLPETPVENISELIKFIKCY